MKVTYIYSAYICDLLTKYSRLVSYTRSHVWYHRRLRTRGISPHSRVKYVLLYASTLALTLTRPVIDSKANKLLSICWSCSSQCRSCVRTHRSSCRIRNRIRWRLGILIRPLSPQLAADKTTVCTGICARSKSLCDDGAYTYFCRGVGTLRVRRDGSIFIWS